MDLASLVALFTAIATAIAAHLKNLRQDGATQQLRKELDQVKSDVQQCDEERARLWEYLFDRADDDGTPPMVM